MSIAITAAERGWVPDWMVRVGIRGLLRARLWTEASRSHDDGPADARTMAIMREGPIALATWSANDQHYEILPEFFRLVLGPHLKYSCCVWPPGTTTLGEAEAAALEQVEMRAGLVDGMRVLDLGCGWGALALWMAARFPKTQVVAVSNAVGQRRFIENICQARGLDNVEVLTVDMNEFAPDGTFDRIISVEMFEHMRNHERLLQRLATWLRPGGWLFVHAFCHQRYSYFFEDGGEDDWMAHYFFTGGMMPSVDLFSRWCSPLQLSRQWRLGGLEYERTARAWLTNLDAGREDVEHALARSNPRVPGRLAAERWRLFFLSCAELFGYHGGDEWFVTQYRFEAGQ